MLSIKDLLVDIEDDEAGPSNTKTPEELPPFIQNNMLREGCDELNKVTSKQWTELHPSFKGLVRNYAMSGRLVGWTFAWRNIVDVKPQQSPKDFDPSILAYQTAHMPATEPIMICGTKYIPHAWTRRFGRWLTFEYQKVTPDTELGNAGWDYRHMEDIGRILDKYPRGDVIVIMTYPHKKGSKPHPNKLLFLDPDPIL